jgi:hypothetical protein
LGYSFFDTRILKIGFAKLRSLKTENLKNAERMSLAPIAVEILLFCFAKNETKDWNGKRENDLKKVQAFCSKDFLMD